MLYILKLPSLIDMSAYHSDRHRDQLKNREQSLTKNKVHLAAAVIPC